MVVWPPFSIIAQLLIDFKCAMCVGGARVFEHIPIEAQQNTVQFCRKNSSFSIRLPAIMDVFRCQSGRPIKSLRNTHKKREFFAFVCGRFHIWVHIVSAAATEIHAIFRMFGLCLPPFFLIGTWFCAWVKRTNNFNYAAHFVRTSMRALFSTAKNWKY